MAIKSVKFIPQGVCAKSMEVTFDENSDNIGQSVITKVEIVGGCRGNRTAVCRLVEGMTIDDVISRLEGIDCQGKGISCPSELSHCLKEFVENSSVITDGKFVLPDCIDLDNRYGDKIMLEQVDGYKYKLTFNPADLGEFLRLGYDKVNDDGDINYTMVDPSGGPYLTIGTQIKNVALRYDEKKYGDLIIDSIESKGGIFITLKVKE